MSGALRLVAVCAVGLVACGGHRPREPATPADADGDGVPDAVDRCPNDPEDYDGWQDDDGCPDADDSGHFIPDVDDRCPIVLDCEEGFIDDDGCPDVIIVFERGSDALAERAAALVDELAIELRDRKRVVKLRLDGHHTADESAQLAEQRAAVVRDRLVEQGTPAGMLETASHEAPSGSDGFVSFFALECAD